MRKRRGRIAQDENRRAKLKRECFTVEVRESNGMCKFQAAKKRNFLKGGWKRVL